MATEKQIAANRENAKRSTGPKTMAGRLKSSRNAYRHGFSSPLPFDPATLAKVDAFAHALAGKEANEASLISASDFAEAQLELSRIRATRTALIAKPTPERCERPVSAASSTAGDHPGRLAQGPEEKQGLAGRRFGFMVPFLQHWARPELMGETPRGQCGCPPPCSQGEFAKRFQIGCYNRQ